MRVARLVYQLAKQIQASEAEAQEAAAAAFFHDIGKRHPRLVPFFEGPHAREIFEEPRTKRLRKWHCLKGPGQLEVYGLGPADRHAGSIVEVCLHHHDKPSQIPQDLKRPELILMAAVADRFDAMTDPERPQRGEMIYGIAAAAARLTQSVARKELDQRLTNLFVSEVLRVNLQ